jgi:hypothetical protein
MSCLPVSASQIYDNDLSQGLHGKGVEELDYATTPFGSRCFMKPNM